jgi:hypothetical protein
VELVEHHRSHAAELGLAEEAAHQQGFRHERETGLVAHLALEAHHVAHAPAHALAELFRHAAGGHARGDAPRLEHHHFAIAPESSVQECGRHAGGLARTGLCNQHEVRRARELL